MKLLRIHDVISVTGVSRMTIYRLEKEGLFPTRRRLGKNSVAWLDEDVTAWVVARPAAQEPRRSVARTSYSTGLSGLGTAAVSSASARSSRTSLLSRPSARGPARR